MDSWATWQPGARGQILGTPEGHLVDLEAQHLRQSPRCLVHPGWSASRLGSLTPRPILGHSGLVGGMAGWPGSLSLRQSMGCHSWAAGWLCNLVLKAKHGTPRVDSLLPWEPSAQGQVQAITVITMISLDFICHHTTILHNYWLYSPHCTFHTCDIYFLTESCTS